MSNLPVDRDKNYMREMWGTTKLITDYDSMIQNSKNNEKKVISEVMYDKAPKHDLLKQTDLHEKIRNDEDYDDWEYGTEPIYGKKW
jgi:Fe-S-cluster formation regulator IscX/YfhJ